MNWKGIVVLQVEESQGAAGVCVGIREVPACAGLSPYPAWWPRAEGSSSDRHPCPLTLDQQEPGATCLGKSCGSCQGLWSAAPFKGKVRGWDVISAAFGEEIRLSGICVLNPVQSWNLKFSRNQEFQESGAGPE